MCSRVYVGGLLYIFPCLDAMLLSLSVMLVYVAHRLLLLCRPCQDVKDDRVSMVVETGLLDGGMKH